MATKQETSSTDRIERQIQIQAPRTRVWRALTTPAELGTWFGVKVEVPAFVPGERVKGQITSKGYEHVTWDITVDRVEPEHLFSWRWHPYAVVPGVDYDQETPTLVTFELEEKDGGTLLKVTESGFDRVPLARRAEAYRMNSGGWEGQLKRIAAHVTRPS
jgi:uncharacterized protein YndB with AHSA1/START domain